MKYIANPVEVEAEKIVRAYPVADQSAGEMNVELEGGNMVQLTAGMIARYKPVAGDYVVRQADGYEYVNPKDVFERKYRRAE